jgi:elongation factor P hydroxylase
MKADGFAVCSKKWMYVLSNSFEFFTFASNLLGEVEAEDIYIKKMVDIYSFCAQNL